MKIVEEFKFEQVIYPQALFDITVDETEVDARVAEVGERFLTIHQVFDEIQQGDIVAIRCDSPKLSAEEQELQFTVGKGLYGKAFEEELVGKSVGMNVQVPLWIGTVPGLIKQIYRRKNAVVTDALIAKMNLEHICTISDYRAYLKEQIAEAEIWRRADGLLAYTEKEVMAHTVFADLASETELLYQKLAAQSKVLAKLEHTAWEECLPWRIPKKYFQASEETKKTYHLEQCEKLLKRRLIAKAWADRTGIKLTQDDYEVAYRQYLDQGLTEEQIAATMDEAAFYEQRYIELYQDAILESCRSRYRIKE